MIEIIDLSLTKQNRNQSRILLNKICLKIHPAEMTLLLGKSGSGKTSILRCLAHIEQKYAGKICYNGTNIAEFSRKDRCQLIGFVPQSYSLFPFMTVLENCTHPLQTVLKNSRFESTNKTKKLADQLGMENLLASYPHELSGGQQQRAAILRALLLNPLFLLFDEPTSALDPENTNLLVEILFRLKSEGKGIVISSQDMSFAQKVCENVCFLEKGEIIETQNFSSSPLPKDSKATQFLYGAAGLPK